ncbi:MAG TPA: AAA family ATPase, partial [Thermomicrobiales bacterium]|nr:AAA family ATPase [Thermomicrobiales bacterium]
MPGFAPIYPDTRAPVLVGRDDELAAAIRTMRASTTRLLTITGPAGVGKTRFGVELARAIVADYPDGAIVIDLTTITEPDALDIEIARAVGLRGADGTLDLDAWMRDHAVLLMLDNAEHVLGIGPRLAQLLSISEGSRAIVTSRHRLHVSIETELYLDTLDVTEPLQPGMSRSGSHTSPAARLFLQVVGA